MEGEPDRWALGLERGLGGVEHLAATRLWAQHSPGGESVRKQRGLSFKVYCMDPCEEWQGLQGWRQSEPEQEGCRVKCQGSEDTKAGATAAQRASTLESWRGCGGGVRGDGRSDSSMDRRYEYALHQ